MNMDKQHECGHAGQKHSEGRIQSMVNNTENVSPQTRNPEWQMVN